MKKPTLDLVLIENRILRDGTFPVKLRVTYERCPVLIGLGISMKREDYIRIWKSKAPRDDSKTRKIKLHKDHIQKGNEILDQMEKDGMETFDFDEFKDRFAGKKQKNDSNLLTMYEKIIIDLDSAGQIGTAGTYRNSKRALLNFIKPKNLEIRYNSIKAKDLKEFEDFIIKQSGLSETTLSIYLRCLRRVYNKAITDNIISKELSPFNDQSNPYVIPMCRNIKKALKPEEIQKLSAFYDFEGSPKLKARDFWLLSFYCYGMNICDILQLKNDNIDGEILHFYRHKIKQSTRKDQKPVLIALDERALKIINQYRSTDTTPSNYLFPILHKDDSPKMTRDKIKNFTRFINQHIKKIAIIEGIDSNISSYYARHSVATIACNNGVKVDKISAMFSHSNIPTTQKYIDSLPLDETRKLSDTIYSKI